MRYINLLLTLTLTLTLYFWYFVFLGIFGLLLFYVSTTSAVDCLERRPRNDSLSVERGVKQLLTHSPVYIKVHKFHYNIRCCCYW